ncbi:MAG: CRISPR-associated protein Csx16 [Methermicoccaceae archaeon]
MKRILVSRHPGAVAWLKSKGFEGEVVAHLTPEMVGEGDVVVGVLPVHLVAELKERGARVIILVLPQVPPEKRGAELSPEEMDRFGARLLEVEELRLKEVV